MSHEDAPPPMPNDEIADERGDEYRDNGNEATLMAAAVDDGDEIRRRGGRTNTQFAVSAMPEGGHTDVNKAGLAARQIAHERLQRPVATRQRPTLLPDGFDLPPKLPTATRDARPELLQPVRRALDPSKRNFGSTRRETSDVISVVDTGDVGQPAPRPMQARAGAPRPPTRPAIKRNTVPPRPDPAQRSAPPRPAPASFLPLPADHLHVRIIEQRQRLRLLDTFARALEVAAGVLGTLSLSVLIATLVSVIAGRDVSVLAAASALVGSATGLALTFLMVVTSASIRQLKHVSAQLAALLDSLSTPRR